MAAPRAQPAPSNAPHSTTVINPLTVIPAFAGTTKSCPASCPAQTEKAGREARLSLDRTMASGRPQKSMPPMPPPPIGGMAGLSFGSSAIIASVVTSRPATEAASWSAVRTTLVGSMMPAAIMST